ncbi:putative ABC transport system permease protein [Kaistia hirudinis]|uniref:Putative ABC transport system permease protein n=1 Tax=Kaistia hirudinis TaxID=1293440 RepID=A0A840APY4_9HYPH|nr:ABC transporter permease [Kaistia hirudinis]MBB3932420.1 putative ABC transport system permease protein [Kaistia hirudinis]
MTLIWILGLFRTRLGRFAGFIAGLAMTVTLVASLGLFMQDSSASMTARAIKAVPVDWQVELVPGADAAMVEDAIGKAASVRTVKTVGYARIDGLEFVGGTVQTTGEGKVVGLDPSYLTTFPQGPRLLAGSFNGAVLLQQTAANLHAGPGDTITLHRLGLPDATTRVSGVVDLQNADSFFQAIGVPPGAAPQAPPDNAILLPFIEWQALFAPQAETRPDSVRLQLHAGLDRTKLPADPNDAYAASLQQGHNFESRVAGSALLANNIAARLDAARGDALYARVLFFFLGAPGIALAALLSIAIAASGSDRRRRDQSLLRLRGAPIATILRFAAAEAVALGFGGVVIGWLLAEMLTRLLFGLTLLSPEGAVWALGPGLVGFALAIAAILIPAWQTARSLSVLSARRSIGQARRPLWRSVWLDAILLAIAALIFWRTASTGYQVVLATEGVAATAVDYNAFLAPVLLWMGAGLLTLRLVDGCLDRGRAALEGILAPLAGPVAGAVAASIRRQRRRLASGVALTALAFAFASSTAIFNTTYQAQARVDAELTNGADVTVTGSSAAPAGLKLDELARIPGVAAIQAMQHRYAYVGNDLQDLYGIDPGTIGTATTMSDAFFAGRGATAALRRLSETPAGVLVSDETVTDYQLNLGDTLNLRLQGADHQYHVVPFVFIGVVREFPTAPRDSFLVANAAYIAKMTGLPAREIILMRASGDMAAVEKAALAITDGLPGIQVRSLAEATHLIGSSLTAVDLSGLTRLELTLAVLMVVGSTGLVLALGLADRRRSFAVLTVLGARHRDLAAFIWSEGAILLASGALIGTATGLLVAWILIKVLSGVFDPPPEAISVPFGYLAIMFLISLVATSLATANALRDAGVDAIQRIKEFS